MIRMRSDKKNEKNEREETMILLLLKLNSWSDRTFILPEKSDRTLIYLDMQITIHANWKQ